MSEIKIRFSGVALPETFNIEPNKTEGKEPSIVCKIRAVDGEHAGTEVFWRGQLAGGAAKITIEALRVMGMTGNDITNPVGLGSTKFDVTGKDEEYQGKTYRRYSVWAPRVRPTLRAEDQKAFSNKFKALLAETGVIAVTDDNRAPAELPAAKATNGIGTAPVAVSDTGAATDLFR